MAKQIMCVTTHAHHKAGDILELEDAIADLMLAQRSGLAPVWILHKDLNPPMVEDKKGKGEK